MLRTQLERGPDAIEIVLKLDEEHAGLGKTCVMTAQKVGRQMLICGQVDHDLIGTFGIDDDAGCRCRHLIKNQPCASELLVFSKAAGRFSERIVAEGTDEQRVAVLADAGNRLVEALAARAGTEARRASCLARLRESVSPPDMILHIAADDDDGGKIAGVACGHYLRLFLKPRY